MVKIPSQGASLNVNFLGVAPPPPSWGKPLVGA